MLDSPHLKNTTMPPMTIRMIPVMSISRFIFDVFCCVHISKYKKDAVVNVSALSESDDFFPTFLLYRVSDNCFQFFGGGAARVGKVDFVVAAHVVNSNLVTLRFGKVVH